MIRRMHAALEAEFESLLAVWRRYDDVRRERGTIKELGESRRRLDSARDRVGELRRALSPRRDELADAVETVMCDLFDTPVAIPWQWARRVDDGIEFRCVCGDLVRRSPSRSVGHRWTETG